MEDNVAGEGTTGAPPPDTLAALLTASLSTKLAAGSNCRHVSGAARRSQGLRGLGAAGQEQ
jgi:hypothetical protein